jgi:hypothetical protein
MNAKIMPDKVPFVSWTLIRTRGKLSQDFQEALPEEAKIPQE